MLTFFPAKPNLRAPVAENPTASMSDDGLTPRHLPKPAISVRSGERLLIVRFSDVRKADRQVTLLEQ